MVAGVGNFNLIEFTTEARRSRR